MPEESAENLSSLYIDIDYLKLLLWENGFLKENKDLPYPREYILNFLQSNPDCLKVLTKYSPEEKAIIINYVYNLYLTKNS